MAGHKVRKTRCRHTRRASLSAIMVAQDAAARSVDVQHLDREDGVAGASYGAGGNHC